MDNAKKRFEEVVENFFEHHAIGPTGKMALFEAHRDEMRFAQAIGELQALDELTMTITKRQDELLATVRNSGTVVRRGIDRLQLGASSMIDIARVRSGAVKEAFIEDLSGRTFRVSGLGNGEVLIERCFKEYDRGE